jgi:hypothetical protein
VHLAAVLVGILSSACFAEPYECVQDEQCPPQTEECKASVCIDRRCVVVTVSEGECSAVDAVNLDTSRPADVVEQDGTLVDDSGDGTALPFDSSLAEDADSGSSDAQPDCEVDVDTICQSWVWDPESRDCVIRPSN